MGGDLPPKDLTAYECHGCYWSQWSELRRETGHELPFPQSLRWEDDAYHHFTKHIASVYSGASIERWGKGSLGDE